MGLIHSRASKKRDKAEARLLDEQRKELKHEHQAERAQERTAEMMAPHPDAWYKEPTIGGLLSRRRAARAGPDPDADDPGPRGQGSSAP
jgi:hypothetical protein